MERIDGVLEIDHGRGVIYFTPTDIRHPMRGQTKLRICQLPKPLPKADEPLDITHMHGASWGK